MQGDGDGLEHGGLRRRRSCRAAGRAMRSGTARILGEGAGAAVLAAGDADDLAVVAEVDFAAQAVGALAAVDGGVEGDAVARAGSGHARGADGSDDARRPRGP